MNPNERLGRAVSLPSGAPRIDPSSWIAPGAVVVGNVAVAAQVGIYYGAVVRAEGASITIGEGSNVQDNCVIHAGLEFNVVIGRDVTVGHAAILHGCTIEDIVLIGMGSILLNHCQVGSGSVIGAGSLVPEGMVIPPRSLALGRPARVIRALSDDEVAEIEAGALHYRGLLAEHADLGNVWTESAPGPTVKGRCPP